MEEGEGEALAEEDSIVMAAVEAVDLEEVEVAGEAVGVDPQVHHRQKPVPILSAQILPTISVSFTTASVLVSEARCQFEGEVVICTYDKKCYSVMELDFDNSPGSLPVDGMGMSHAQYFMERKGIELKYPTAKPIVAVLGRNNRRIYLPAELVCANELDPMIKQKLPMIASFTPPQRHDAIE